VGNLASVIDELNSIDLDDLPVATVGELIVETRRQINRLEAAYLRMVERFDRRGGAVDCGSTQSWARSELHLSPTDAHRDVALARDLADVMPATMAALRDGAISPAHAQAISRLRRTVGDAAVAAAEPHLADVARESTPKDLRAVAAHVAHSYSPERFSDAEQGDYERRRFDASSTINGLGVGSFTLHPAGFETLMTALHAASRPVKGDDRTPTQRRADALVTIAELALNSGELPIAGGVKPHVTMIVTPETVQGCDGAAAADLSFGAVVGANWAQRFSCDAEIARVIFGPAGEVLDSGRSSRTFTAAQIRAIIARDRTCVWPGCDAPPGWCDAHHIVHWANGGPTSVENGVLLCGRHHDRVHIYGHPIEVDERGRYQVNRFKVRESTQSRGKQVVQKSWPKGVSSMLRRIVLPRPAALIAAATSGCASSTW
jgi:hypothetical protein